MPSLPVRTYRLSVCVCVCACESVPSLRAHVLPYLALYSILLCLATGNLDDLVHHCLLALRESLPSEAELTDKVRAHTTLQRVP